MWLIGKEVVKIQIPKKLENGILFKLKLVMEITRKESGEILIRLGHNDGSLVMGAGSTSDILDAARAFTKRFPELIVREFHNKTIPKS